MRNLLLIFCLIVTSVWSIPSQWFSANSCWNAVLPDNAPISPNSTRFIQGLLNQVKQYTPWINVDQYSVPVYTVPQNQPTVTVTLQKPDSPGCVNDLRADFQAVPIPPGAVAANGTDMHMAIWSPSTDTMWEFWSMQKNSANNWVAKWGGKMDNVKSNPGFYLAPCTGWGATATSLALVGGLVLIDEIKSGVIEHALPLALVETEDATFVTPAERGDGWSKSSNAIPEGTRFRLPADLDIPSLKLPPFGELLAYAMQKYGGLVRDTAGATVWAYCEPPAPGQPNPYEGPNGFFKGLYPSQILAAFPWDKLQVVDPSWQPWKTTDN